MKYVGIDVSKDKLDIFIRPDARHFIIDNNQASLDKLAKELHKLNPQLIAMEATGSYHKDLVKTLVKAGLKTSVVNPKLIKNFSRSGGARAKTDKLDSAVIAHYAEVYKPREVVLASDDQLELDELVTRRRQLIDIKIAETNRLKQSKGIIAQDIANHIEWLEKRIKEIDIQLNERIQQSEQLRTNSEIMESVQGVGKVLTSTLLMGLPELGKFSGKKLSALVGLAPFNRDSGKLKGQMKIYGGRKEIRSAMYMPTWSAVRHNTVIREFYQKLIAKGKKPKVAIVACMRKLLIILNSLIKQGIKWNPQYSATRI
jgi:transposase